MDRMRVSSAEQGEAATTSRMRPRASSWFWQPLYAKAWWGAVAVYWSGKLASYWNGAAAEFYSTALAGFLNIAFFPPVAIIILGVGFTRAWLVSNHLYLVEPSREQMYSRRSVGGWRDPMIDPLDPRSPSHFQYLDDLK